MKVTDLMEGPKEDMAKLQDGAKLFQAIIKYVYAAQSEGGKAFFEHTYEQDGKTFTYLTLPMVRIDYDAEYRDLVLVLWDRDIRWGGHYYSKWEWGHRDGATKAIVIYTKNITAPLTALQHSASIFTHEFIHYLDDKRAKVGISKMRKPYTKKEDEEGYDQEYYNNPVEFNAYFLQGAREMIMMCDRTIRLRREIPKDFRQFLYTFTLENGFFHGTFRTFIEGKWRKKFIRRMKVLHDFLIKRYETGEKPKDALP